MSMLTGSESDFILYDQPLLSLLSWKCCMRYAQVRTHVLSRAPRASRYSNHVKGPRVYLKGKKGTWKWKATFQGKRGDTQRERWRDTRIPGRGMIESGCAGVLLRTSCSRSQYQRRINPLPCVLATEGPIDFPSENQLIDSSSSDSYEAEEFNFNRRVHSYFPSLPLFLIALPSEMRRVFFFRQGR